MQVEYGYVAEEDFQKLLSTITERDEMYAVALLLIRYRGIRPKNVAALKLADFDFERQTVAHHNTKANRLSHRPLPRFVAERVQRYIRENQHRFVNGYIFCAPNSARSHISTNTLAKKFRHYFKKAELSCGWHIDTNTKILNAGRKIWHTRLYDLKASFLTDVHAHTKDDYATCVIGDHTDPRSAWQYRRRVILINEQKTIKDIFERPRLPQR